MPKQNDEVATPAQYRVKRLPHECGRAKTELTPRQKAFYEFVKQHEDTTGSYPSLGAAAKQFGFSRSAADVYYRALKKKGYL